VVHDVFVYDAIRTPRGKFRGGSLHGVKPVTLTVGLLHAIQERNPSLDPNRIDDVVLGCVTAVRDQGSDIARIAAVAAGLPDTVAGVQLNRFCASGLEAVNTAAQKIASGWESLVVAGGVESMSRVHMGSSGGAWANDPETNFATRYVPQGIGADLIATIEGFSREDVDSYAAESQGRAAKAWANGAFDRSVVPVVDRNGETILDRDEHMRPSTTLETLGKLKPAFDELGNKSGFDAVALQKYHWIERINHVHTGGNSSGIVDGAALVLLGNEQVGKDLGLTPRARVTAAASIGSEPTIMLTGPAPACRKALAVAGLTVDDIDLIELNEAFASVVLKFMRDLDVPHDIVNVNGGAIALGHPLGATGAMLISTIIDELERRDLQRGLVTLCVGAGMGTATVIERV
jgi:acetyl-CoA C-acetyltransferase